MAVHWNVNGEPNEFMSKQVVVAFIPCFIIFSYGFLYIISHNIFKFNERGHGIIGGFIKKITLFMLFIHMLILFINFRKVISFQTGLTIGISMFLFMLSKEFKKIKGKEKDPIKLQKIRLVSRRIFQVMAWGILFSLFLNLEWGFYVLLSIISCGSMLFMLYIFYSYIIESYET
ncbi:Predicted integral membrane protein [Streptococcus pneumoniae]|nr:Predicted integral membrane protein [Streptococcus pneumoniae]